MPVPGHSRTHTPPPPRAIDSRVGQQRPLATTCPRWDGKPQRVSRDTLTTGMQLPMTCPRPPLCSASPVGTAATVPCPPARSWGLPGSGVPAPRGVPAARSAGSPLSWRQGEAKGCGEEISAASSAVAPPGRKPLGSKETGGSALPVKPRRLGEGCNFSSRKQSPRGGSKLMRNCVSRRPGRVDAAVARPRLRHPPRFIPAVLGASPAAGRRVGAECGWLRQGTPPRCFPALGALRKSAALPRDALIRWGQPAAPGLRHGVPRPQLAASPAWQGPAALDGPRAWWEHPWGVAGLGGRLTGLGRRVTGS